MRKLDMVLLALLVVLGFVFVGQYKQARGELAASKTQFVQTVCDDAHHEISGTSEQACGDAQDQAHAEYLCDSAAATAHCWVELK